MSSLPWRRSIAILLALLWAGTASADVQPVLVQTEIDDDHIIIVTEDGEQLLLEKWSMRFSPLAFEGKTFFAEISPMWVTIHIPNRDPIKWSIEKNLGYVGGKSPSPPPAQNPEAKPQPKAPPNKTACYKTNIQEPSPFNGNGGELILLANGSIWKEVSYQYLYLYEYYPLVIVCPSEGRMILKDHVFQIVRQR